MNPPTKLLEDLRKKDFIAAEDNDFNTFSELQAAIVEHVFGHRKDETSVVRFDAECIESTDAYTHLIKLFIDAIPADLGISEITSHYDRDAETARCSLNLAGELLEAEWNQDSDWVAPEFLDFILGHTVCGKGRYSVIDTGDQTFCAIFLNKGMSEALARYRKNDSGSREAFINQHAGGNLAFFDGIEILPRQVFKTALARLRQRFGNDGDLLDPGAYQTDNMRAFLGVSDSDDALACYRIVGTVDNGFTCCAAINQFNYEAICPDETAYFLSLKDTQQEVAFEYPAKKVGLMVGEGRDFGPYALLGKASDWAIIVARSDYANPAFICLGEAVIDLLGDSVADTRDNATAQYYESIRDDWFEPMASELGYAKHGSEYWRSLVKQHDHHAVKISLQGSQRDHRDALHIQITFSLSHSVVNWVFRSKRLPDGPVANFSNPELETCTRVGEICRDISNEADFKALLADPGDTIRDLHEQASRERPLEKWLEVYLEDEDYLRAGIAAHILGKTELAEKYFQRQYEIENGPGGFWHNRNIIKKLAEGLNVTIKQG